jgi:hypothetical protein
MKKTTKESTMSAIRRAMDILDEEFVGTKTQWAIVAIQPTEASGEEEHCAVFDISAGATVHEDELSTIEILHHALRHLEQETS